MSAHLERSRNGCALHGALQTLEAIDGVVPVIHATAGCGVQHVLGGVRGGGAALPGIVGGTPLSSSNIGEKHVVFGGGSRLREQLKNSLKLVPGELYVVVSGCATEMVGDDIPAMTREGREQGFPVIHAATPGFRGGPHAGYEQVVRALLEQLPSLPTPEVAVPPGLVNIWGIVPQQDLFWQGHLLELSRLLGRLGLTANPLFGPGEGVGGWQRVPHAALNLVLSPWGGEAALLLEEKYGTPSLSLPGLPIGPAASGRLLQQVSELLRLDPDLAARVRDEEARGFNRHLARLADSYYRYGWQREFVLVGETALVTGMTEFLVGTLGLLPRLAIITDNPPEPRRAGIVEQLRTHLDPYAAAIVFSEESGEISDLLGAGNAELVLASSLEAEAAARLAAPLLTVSFPVRDRVILTRGYAGYRGALALLEDLGSVIQGASVPTGGA